MKMSTIINKKNKKQELTYNEIEYAVNSYVNKKITDDEMTLFIKAIYENGMNREEVYFLTDAMIKTGSTVDLSSINKPIVDKHSTGGVGDKTSMILLPICASLGIAVPKMSGRSLGLTGGTVDKLESIPGYNSNLPLKKFLEIVNNVGCADIAQNKTIAVADKKIYELRDRTGYVDSLPLIASSIMSKKIACGSKNIIIDLKLGNGAFVNNRSRARRLAKLMIYIGKRYDRNVVCILTDMNMPLGNSIGNILEVKEVVNFFNGERDKRLEDIIIRLATEMVSASKNIGKCSAKKEVMLSLSSGLAKSKFYDWIESQGGDIKSMKINAHKIDVRSTNKGYIKEINAKAIGSLCTDLAKDETGKINYSTGVVLRKKIGDFVEIDDVVATIYYNKNTDGMIGRLLGAYKFSPVKPKSKKSVICVIK